MNKELQTVYVPTGHKKWEEKFKVHTTDKSQPQFANEKSGYFFTPEELEKQKAEWQREAAEKLNTPENKKISFQILRESDNQWHTCTEDFYENAPENRRRIHTTQ